MTRRASGPKQNERRQLRLIVLGNVSQVSVQDQAVVVPQESAFQNAKDEAEREGMQVGASYEAASSVPTEDERGEHEIMPAAGQDDAVASFQADDQNRGDAKDFNEKAELPPCEIECIFVSDTVKSERLPKVMKRRPALVDKMFVKVVPSHEYELLHLSEVGKGEKPYPVPSAACEQAARHGGVPSEPYIELARSAKTTSSGVGKQTEGKHKAGRRTLLDSLHHSSYFTHIFGLVRLRLRRKNCTAKELQPSEAAAHTVWLSSELPWRPLAVVRSARRRKHRWKRKCE